MSLLLALRRRQTEPEVQPQPPQTGGSVTHTSGRAKAGSGRWVRIDRDLEHGRTKPTYGRGFTTSVAVSVPQVVTGHATFGTSFAASVAVLPVVTGRTLDTIAVGMTSSVKVRRDDTAEVMRLIDLVDMMKRAA